MPTADRLGTPGRPSELTVADVRWLHRHEARSHGLVGREVRELGDAVLLTDPLDREPFWNRVAGLAWPAEPGAFDRRLAELLALFAGLDRLPHVWSAGGYDEPADLVARLLANGFEDMGHGMMMVLDPAAWPGPAIAPGPDTTIERLHGLDRGAADGAAHAAAAILLEAFAVEAERRSAIAGELAAAFATPEHHVVLARVDGEPAAVARRTTFGGGSYLSSIGVRPRFRGRGLGRLVTEVAVVDALAEASRWTYLGVFEENTRARSLYERLGFVLVGGPAPDLLLRP